MQPLLQDKLTEADIAEAVRYSTNWNLWIDEILGLNLDLEQRKIVDSVQHNRRTSARSGHARGKYFYDWGGYNYCQKAIQRDREMDFIVKVINGNEGKVDES